jgi:hypothetical protein
MTPCFTPGAVRHRILGRTTTPGYRGMLWAIACIVCLTGLDASTAWADGAAPAGATPGGGVATADSVGVAKKEEPASARFPINGEIRVDTMLSAGTFAPGESRRSGFDTILGYRFAFVLPHGFTLSASELITKTLVTYADSGASRPQDTTFGDVFLGASWGPRIRKADGKFEPWLLPGGIRPGFGLTFTVPNSRASRFQGKYGAFTPTISLAMADLLGGHVSLAYSFGFIKNLHRFTNATVSQGDFPTLARPSGPELAGSEILTSTANVSFAFRNMLAANVKFNDRWSASLTWLLFNNFRYYDAPADEFTSIYAKSGRGRSDSQWGIAAVTYGLDAESLWTLSAQAFTVAPPFSADNQTYRFPFYDFRSTADNYTSVGLELQRTF